MTGSKNLSPHETISWICNTLVVLKSGHMHFFNDVVESHVSPSPGLMPHRLQVSSDEFLKR